MILAWELCRLVLGRARHRKLRTLLAAAGVGIGAASLVFLSNLTRSASAAVEEKFESLGGNVIAIAPQRGPAAKPLGLGLDDGQALMRLVPGIVGVAPMVQFRSAVQACGMTVPVGVMAAGPLLHQMASHKPLSGRLLSEIDERRGRPAALMTRALASRLRCLSGESDLAQLQGHTIRIVGVLADIGSLPNAEPETLLVTGRFLQERLGARLDGGIALWAVVSDRVSTEQVVANISTVIRRRHRIGNEEDLGLDVRRREDLVGEAREFESSARTVLLSVMFWSFLISGVGIANAVFSSVLERTPSIGLQRAVGAKKRHVRFEFLVESGAISATGAVLGVVVGSLASAVVALYLEIPVRLDGGSSLVAVVSAVGLGVVAGVWPAMHAANLSPVVALGAE